MSEQTTAVAVGRKVIITSSRGGASKVIENFTGTTWGDLKPLVTSNGYDLGSMKVIEGTTKVTLEHLGGVLPTTDIYLFLMQVVSKSGAKKASEKTAREKVKEFFASNKEHARAHFGNYTQQKEAQLAALLATYKHEQPKAKKTKEATSKKVAADKPKRVKKVTLVEEPFAPEAAQTLATTPIRSEEELRQELKEFSKTIPNVKPIW